jgi:PKD repeat protein
MFTTGQRTRMRAALISSTASRNNLWSSGNLAATGVGAPDVLCKADFTASRRTMCVGDSTRFSDLSFNGNPTSWNWTFNGGAPATSIDSMPWVTYTTAGSHDVTLTATNGTGSPSETKTNYIVVFPVSAQYSNPTYTEDFEGSPLPNSDWNITSNAGPSFLQNTSVGFYGTKCMWLNNFAATSGDVDIAYSPVIDLTAITSPKLYFRVAFAQTNSIDEDILRVYCSTNCGATWVKRYEKAGAALATTPYVFSSFTPTNGSQWRLDSVSISPYAGANDFIFKFEFHAGGGNNIFIDEINIFAPSMIGMQEEAMEQYNFNVFPNPVENNSTVSFTLPEKQTVNIKLLDILGQEISTLANGELNAGEHKYAIGSSTMSSGVYFIRFTSGEKAFTRKVVVN